MAVLILLLAFWFLFRLVGALGLTAFATWHDSARYALAVMFLFTASAHFTRMKHDLANMIPSFFFRPLLIVHVTGVLELLGAVGLLLPKFKSVAALCLMALLIGMSVGNVNAAQKGVTLRGKPATALWLRLPMQLFFFGLLWWSTH